MLFEVGDRVRIINDSRTPFPAGTEGVVEDRSSFLVLVVVTNEDGEEIVQIFKTDEVEKVA